MCHIFLILAAVERAGAVDEKASGAESLPEIGCNLTLAGGTLGHKPLAPLGHRLGILAHHTLARAWHIGHDDIEGVAQTREGRCVAAGDNHPRVTPLDDVLAQHCSP